MDCEFRLKKNMSKKISTKKQDFSSNGIKKGSQLAPYKFI